jgi:hypothetical protein
MGFTQESFKTGFTQDSVTTGFSHDSVETGLTLESVKTGFTQDSVKTCFTQESVKTGFTQKSVKTGFAQDSVQHLLKIVPCLGKHLYFTNTFWTSEDHLFKGGLLRRSVNNNSCKSRYYGPLYYIYILQKELVS